MWLLKTEPGDYSFDQLEQAGRARWDGVRNPAAIRNLAAMKAGDRVFVYHTGDQKAVVGLAEVVKPAYPDPKYPDGKLMVVDIEARGKLGVRRHRDEQRECKAAQDHACRATRPERPGISPNTISCRGSAARSSDSNTERRETTS